jgi:hypothetical protein
MPEAAIYKRSHPLPSEDDVGRTAQSSKRPDVDPESKPAPMEDASECQLDRRVS